MVDRKLRIVDLGIVDPYLNLAIEEYLYNYCPEGEHILFLWQNDKSVIFGQGQSVYSQCNVDLVNKMGINIVRRRSGGGAVYHDLGNLNYSIISEYSDSVCAENMSYICKTLQKYGVQANPSGRNDILANGKKFSGNAYVSDGNRICHHGTLLINSDLSVMYDVLNVPEKKWRDKGIDSVRSRTINLSFLNGDITVEGLKNSLKEAFALGLSDDRIFNITSLEGLVDDYDSLKNLQAFYKSDDWIWGKRLGESLTKSKWFQWGNVELELKLERGKISDLCIYSDMMETDIIPSLVDNLRGIPFNRDAVCRNLNEMETSANRKIIEDIKEFILVEMIDGV